MIASSARSTPSPSWPPNRACARKPPPARPAEKTYTVVAGDSLSKIAKKFYGDANKWKKIFEANKDQIKNPDLIKPGQTFKIPD